MPDFLWLSPVLVVDQRKHSPLPGRDGFQELVCQVNIPGLALSITRPDYVALSKKQHGFGIDGLFRLNGLANGL